MVSGLHTHEHYDFTIPKGCCRLGDSQSARSAVCNVPRCVPRIMESFDCMTSETRHAVTTRVQVPCSGNKLTGWYADLVDARLRILSISRCTWTIFTNSVQDHSQRVFGTALLSQLLHRGWPMRYFLVLPFYSHLHRHRVCFSRSLILRNWTRLR